MSAGLCESLVLRVAAELKRPHLALLFQRVQSEEALVWRIQIKGRSNEVLAWLKQHKTDHKADREWRALRRWGVKVGAPVVIARPDDRSLLLEHCEGVGLYESGQDGATLLGKSIATLHLEDHEDLDRLPLCEALEMRFRRSIASAPTILEVLRMRAPSLEESFKDRIINLNHSFENKTVWREDGERRVICHRDLRAENVLISITSKGHGSARLIDWGQSRADHWSSDWVKLWLDSQFVPFFRSAWRAYRQRMIEAHDGAVAPPSLVTLQQQATIHLLNTFDWSLRSKRLDVRDEVFRRGLNELKTLNKRDENLLLGTNLHHFH